MSQTRMLRRLAGVLVLMGAVALGAGGCVMVPAPPYVAGPPVIVVPRPPVVVAPPPVYGYHYYGYRYYGYGPYHRFN